MSSLSIDASGSRPMTLTVNDPAATKAWMPSRQDDDATIQINSAAEVAFMLPSSARIERRTLKDYSYADGKSVEIGEREVAFLVLGDADEKEPSQSLYVMVKNRRNDEVAQMHPHISIVARKELPLERSGEHVATHALADLLGAVAG